MPPLDASTSPSQSPQSLASSLAYQQAGVSLESAAGVVSLARQAAAKTRVPDLPVIGGIGGFSGAFQLPSGYQNPVMLAACDGVGTKVLLAHQLDNFSTVGIDLVAMNANDLLANGGRPLVFMDYMASGQLSLVQAEALLNSVAEGCVQAGCQLLGGETAEMPGLYAPGHVDVAGFCLGVAEKDHLYPKIETIEPGDAVIGLASSGFHSNGYSLVRKVLAEASVDLTQPAPWRNEGNAPLTLADAVLAPTRMYVKPILALLQAQLDAVEPSAIKAMAHITGGGFVENLPRVLPQGTQAELLPWALPPIYQWFQHLSGLDWATLSHTFNAGVGFVIVAVPHQAEAIMAFLTQQDAELAPSIIGQITAQPDSIAEPKTVWS